MAKRSEKKRQKAKPVQPSLPGMPPPEPPGTVRVLPMDLRVGDRLTDETGEWEVVSRPYTIGGGKNARVRVQREGDPATRELRTWGAHERTNVKRASGPHLVPIRGPDEDHPHREQRHY
jgi:hypothetical protein